MLQFRIVKCGCKKVNSIKCTKKYRKVNNNQIGYEIYAYRKIYYQLVYSIENVVHNFTIDYIELL